MSVKHKRSPVRHQTVPQALETQVWIDFDGTITRSDVLDEIIKGFAVDDSWMSVEREWQDGLIGSAECLRRQLAVVRITDQQLDPFLDSIPIDPGAVRLINACEQNKVPVSILSDGIDLFIRSILRRGGLAGTAFRCNSITRDHDAMSLVCPHSNDRCEAKAAHCKCESMSTMGVGRAKTIYIGDGRSDLCPSRKVDCRFAKGVLAANLAREGLAFISYSTLDDIADIFEHAWARPAPTVRKASTV